MGNGVCTSQASLAGKTVVITGANVGIGKATAVDLARRNGRVILACRSAEKGESAAADIRAESGNSDVVFRQLDLASLASVRRFAAQILEEEPRIDILINNAGVMGCPYSKTEDGFEMQFGVNHLGHFLLTNLLLERMKESPAARIVTVSGDIYRMCSGIKFDDLSWSEGSQYSPNGAYTHSKLANILFTNALAKRLEGTRVTANSLHPGVIAETELARHSRERHPWLSKIAFPIFTLFTKSLEQGAQTTIHCAVAEELEGVSGRYFKDCQEASLNRAASNAEAAERLWEVSAQMVGLDS